MEPKKNEASNERKSDFKKTDNTRVEFETKLEVSKEPKSTFEKAGPADEVPEGAAVFPAIPEELGIHPLLLATLHAIVFFDGSSEDVLHAAAAEEAVQYCISYLRRLEGAELQRVREDIDCLIAYATQEKWPQEEMDFLTGFLQDYFIGVPNTQAE